ncbi:riboflavin synthase [Patescibacteria group bacterium]|nr:MAG: riboflavin synthase [Patescibacteria group bacterium]
MFTGIIETVGVVKEISNHIFTITVKNFLADIKIGDSIAVNGVCTTVIALDGDSFQIEIMPETFRVTNFSALKVGDDVNLEKSLKVGERLDGHFVLGHVDGVGAVEEIKTVGEYAELVISSPPELRVYLARKGTVAINGISLTIAEDMGERFRVALISHTREITNLKNIKVRDRVNIEVDVIARYLEKLCETKK